MLPVVCDQGFKGKVQAGNSVDLVLCVILSH